MQHFSELFLAINNHIAFFEKEEECVISHLPNLSIQARKRKNH